MAGRLGKSDPDQAALLLRLFGTHLQVHSDRIMKAMILERLDQEIQPHIEQLPTEQSVDQIWRHQTGPSPQNGASFVGFIDGNARRCQPRSQS